MVHHRWLVEVIHVSWCKGDFTPLYTGEFSGYCVSLVFELNYPLACMSILTAACSLSLTIFFHFQINVMSMQTVTKPLPFFFVGKDVTRGRVNNYLTCKHNLLSTGLGKPDTKSIWYSKEHIVKLLEEIEYAEGDGIRIQFGMYEEGHEFAGQLCLVMNTTRENRVNNIVRHTNVVLENEPDYEERSSRPRDIILFPGDGFSIPRDFNYGSPCPPRCDDPGGDE